MSEQPHINILDDGTTLTEWVGENWRFTICLTSANTSERCHWKFVSRQEIASGYLNPELFDAMHEADS
jgi:hypothetical protein